MKKTYLTMLVVFIIIAGNILYHASGPAPTAHGYGSGAPDGHTGSPGDGNLCTSCHADFPPTPQSGWITSNIPATGYVPGTTYTITATATQSGINKFGFQVSPQNTSGTPLGTLVNTSTQTQLIGSSSQYITHTSSGTFGSGSKSWVFNWVAPALGTGNVTFYGAFNAANGDLNSTGDLIYVSTLTVNEAAPLVSPPTTSDQNRCGSGTLTLTASGGINYRWYKDATGGPILGTNASFTTPVLTQTDSFYVANYDGVNESTRVKARAIIHAVPNPPTASNVSNCGPGPITLHASGSGSVSYKWFSSASGGTALHTGTSFTTPNLSSTTTYYVEADNGFCLSTRTAVDAVINPVPSSPTAQGGERCGNGQVELSASSANTLLWYDVATGGNPIGTGSPFMSPSISSTTTFYAVSFDGNCESARAAVLAEVNPVPPQPVVADESRCGAGTISYTVSGPYTYYWFDQPTGGSPLQAGTSFTTPHLASTATFYVEAEDGNCISPRVSFQAIVNTTMPDPVAADVSRCGEGTVTLTASAPGASTYVWYDATGTNPLHTGPNFTTPVIQSSTTYLVEAVGSNCTSQQVGVMAVILQLPPEPSTSDGERCGPGTLTLTASGGPDINWYASAGAVTPLATGASFTTPQLANSTTYYVSSQDANCESNRVPAEAIINTVPPQPSVLQPDNSTLQCSATGQNYQWEKDGNLLPDKTREITVELPGLYKVAVESNEGCWSEFSDAFDYTGNSIETFSGGKMVVFPNPASNELHIKFNKPEEYLVQLTDVTGKLAWQEKGSGSMVLIDISGFSRGLYYILVQTDKERLVEKTFLR